ncbi:hypothetical protein SKAU_G00413380 [Synaphobranchus kaupii]|uniref:Reverse transcriptase domain-containing protein n=1 Tax=Synaphobranchus kaupii TaxID=118154 RepID=A0A9Q1IBX5_SYNKA|nr:hypothetical protein SKAU_G00413380 [Synaphobranchus kaupii]
MGCSISPILFTAAFEIILIGGKQMVRGVRNQSGQRLPALRSYMDDVTTLLQTAACTNRLLKRLEELLIWARIKIKPAKSLSLSIRKGARSDNISFSVDGAKIPLLVEQPVRSLGRLYTADLSDKHMTSSIMTQLSEGLGKLDQSHLPGNLVIWCYQFTLYQRLMWPLKLSEIASTAVLKMDSKANNYIRKWLGLPRCLSNVALFGRNTLQLPLRSLYLGYRQEKVRLVFELRDSSDPFVQKAKAPVRTWRKWRAEQAVDQAIRQLKHQEIVGWLQTGRSRLGWGPAPQRRRGSLKEGEEGAGHLRTNCHLCDTQNPSLQHILTGCKSALTRYRWRHDQVLRKLAEVLEARRLEVNKTSSSTSQLRIHFVRQGAEAQNINQNEWSALTPGCEWNMRVDLDQQFKFPVEIATTSLRPDIVLWSTSSRTVIMAELTVPWEEGTEQPSKGRRRSTVSCRRHVQKQGGRHPPTPWKSAAEVLLENPSNVS